MENSNNDAHNSPLSAQPSTEEINEKIETVIPDGEKEAIPVNDKEEETPTNETGKKNEVTETDETEEGPSASKDSSPADDIETVSS